MTLLPHQTFACIATSSYGYGQPELHSLPPPCPLPSPPRLCSSSMTPSSYQQILPMPAFDDGSSSLHAGGISQPSFNASGSIILSADLDAPVFSPLSILDDDGQPEPPPPQAQPALTTTSTGMVLGQMTDSFFGLAAQDTSMQPLSSFPSSFGPSPTMHGIPFPDLQEAPPPAVSSQSQSQLATPLTSLGSQQQPARPSSPAPSSLILLGQRDRFTGFRHLNSALQQGRTTWSSSRSSAGLPPRWRAPRSRIDDTTTFGYVQPSSDSMLAPLPPSLLQTTPPSPPVEQAAGPTGSETPGKAGGFILPQGNDVVRALTGPPPLLDSASREMFQLSRSSFMDDSSMVSMPTLSIGASGSSGGSLLFTDAEMEKIRKEEHLSHLIKTDPKRVRRMLKNRESALKAKERMKSHRVCLEDRLRALEMEHETLSRKAKLQEEELAELASQNRILSTRLQGMDQQLKLKKELNEALRSRIQNLKLGNLSSSSSLHQQMSLAGVQCSNIGLHQHI